METQRHRERQGMEAADGAQGGGMCTRVFSPDAVDDGRRRKMDGRTRNSEHRIQNTE